MGIEEKFRDKAIIRGGLFLFSGTVSLQVIKEAQLENVAILGIDGFFLSAEGAQPSLDDSIDFSVGENVTKFAYASAEDFIRRHENSNLYFEFVFEPKHVR